MSELNFKTFEGHQTLTSEMAFLLSELDRQYFPTPWGLEAWQNLFLNNDRQLILLHIEGEIKGFCLFNKSLGDSFAHLLKILVHPNMRKRGLSKLLLIEGLINLESIGYTQFFLEVEEDNYAAQRLYLSVGFQTIHRKKDFYGANRSAFIMTRANKSHS